MKTFVFEVLNQKGSTVVATHADATVYDTIAQMVEKNVGSMVVTEGDQVVGIFTERDYLRRIILQGRTSKTTRLGDVMTSGVVTANPGSTISSCLSTMTAKKCRHLPILQDGKLVGVISIGDCVKALLNNAERQVESLTHYITGQYPV